MKNLDTLLERFRKSLFADQYRKERIIQTIKSSLNVELLEEKVFYKDGVLELTASAAQKNEIRLKEEEIKRKLKQENININRILYL